MKSFSDSCCSRHPFSRSNTQLLFFLLCRRLSLFFPSSFVCLFNPNTINYPKGPGKAAMANWLPWQQTSSPSLLVFLACCTCVNGTCSSSSVRLIPYTHKHAASHTSHAELKSARGISLTGACLVSSCNPFLACSVT